jgi:hypothetical protein
VIENNLSGQPTMASDDIYLEEMFTDRRVGVIRRLTPVKPDGTPDALRPVLFSGQAQLLTAVGAIPLSFDIEASSLEEAVRRFSDGAKDAVEHTMAELQQLRREAASSIIVPESGAGAFGGAGGVPGVGMPAGGKIRLR